jgi:hypothetical protein
MFISSLFLLSLLSYTTGEINYVDTCSGVLKSSVKKTINYKYNKTIFYIKIKREKKVRYKSVLELRASTGGVSPIEVSPARDSWLSYPDGFIVVTNRFRNSRTYRVAFNGIDANLDIDLGCPEAVESREVSSGPFCCDGCNSAVICKDFNHEPGVSDCANCESAIFGAVCYPDKFSGSCATITPTEIPTPTGTETPTKTRTTTPTETVTAVATATHMGTEIPTAMPTQVPTFTLQPTTVVPPNTFTPIFTQTPDFSRYDIALECNDYLYPGGVGRCTVRGKGPIFDGYIELKTHYYISMDYASTYPKPIVSSDGVAVWKGPFPPTSWKIDYVFNVNSVAVPGTFIYPIVNMLDKDQNLIKKVYTERMEIRAN